MSTVGDSLTGATALRDHWPEYLIEAWALGTFMVSAGVFTILVEHPQFPLRHLIADPDVRRLLVGLAMGVTAVGLIYSVWGKRSGAHMNPAVTIAFLRLGKMHRWDAVYYIAFQVLGGLAGVLMVRWLFGEAFTAPPVSYVVTVPGQAGVAIAFGAEFLMSMALMFAILFISNHIRWERFTGLAAGAMVATYITLEAPISGMSINPARTFASALPAGIWSQWWLYLIAPVLGMLTGAELYRRCWPRVIVRRAKLVWCDKQRCIHSGYVPPDSSNSLDDTDVAARDSNTLKGDS